MNWNYRLVRHLETCDGNGTELPKECWEVLVELREVYYDEAGNPMGHAAPRLFSETEDGAREVMRMVAEGAAKPMIDWTVGDFRLVD